MPTGEDRFFTTRELAALLRIKERKVYDLAAAGDVPCIRVVGKLLFPRAEIEAWLAGARSGPGAEVAPLPPILAGSHDPLLDWALRESRSGLAAFFDGSLDGLDRLARREAAAAGLHLLEDDGSWNGVSLRRALPAQPVVLVEFARRSRGLITAPGNPMGLRTIGDLAGVRLIRRQAEAASQRLLEALMRQAGLDPDAAPGPASPARGEADLAVAVQAGKADVAFGLEAVAHQFRLGFVPLTVERYDLAVWRQAWFEPPLQRLVTFCHGARFAGEAAGHPGYDISGFGRVHYNAPCP